MSADRKRILSPFGGRKKRMSPNKRQRCNGKGKQTEFSRHRQKFNVQKAIFYFLYENITLSAQANTPFAFKIPKSP